jgi:2-polyprenyl-3-methyl-5-hydroxy-6-metoxy-1,4-benzoquinol methylase
VGTLDVYRITDKLDHPTLDVVVTRLEARGKHPRFIAMMDQYLDAMYIDFAKTVLDVGCGTGVAARAIAQRNRFAGHITGIDVRSAPCSSRRKVTTGGHPVHVRGELNPEERPQGVPQRGHAR